MPKKLLIKYVKSAIGYDQRQKRTITALGLRHLGDAVEQEDSSVIRGMVHKVAHLVEVSEVDSIMKLHELREAKGTKRGQKRRGRGPAAGQGKTGGYGTKGDGARSGRGGNIYFEGGQLPLVRRLPHRRGFRNVNRVAYAGINVAQLCCFAAGTIVDPELLRQAGLVRSPKANCLPVKLLGDGVLDRALTIKGCAVTETAREKIVAAGGTCEE